MKQLLVILLPVVIFTSCKREYEKTCINKAKTWIYFKSRDSSQVYIGYSCTPYSKGGGFSGAAAGSTTIATSGNTTEIVANTDSFSLQFDHFDWLITLFPQGTQFKITEVTRYPHTETTKDDDMYCYNALSFKLNDSLINIPSEKTFTSSTHQYIHITY